MHLVHRTMKIPELFEVAAAMERFAATYHKYAVSVVPLYCTSTCSFELLLLKSSSDSHTFLFLTLIYRNLVKNGDFNLCETDGPMDRPTDGWMDTPRNAFKNQSKIEICALMTHQCLHGLGNLMLFSSFRDNLGPFSLKICQWIGSINTNCQWQH